MYNKKGRLCAGLVGLVLGLIVGALFCFCFSSLLHGANAYDDFINEVPFGFLKIMSVCALIPAVVFLLVPEGWGTRMGISAILLLMILMLTIIALAVSTFGVAETLLTVFLIASLLSGGGTVLVIIIGG